MEGSASNKRKIKHVNYEEEDHEKEDDDEQKMEKFFALIKRIHETRETLKWSGENKEKKNKKQKIMGEEDQKQVEVWNPSFRHEDFIQNDGKFNNPPLEALVCTSPIEDGATKEDVKEELDLKLSL